MRPAVARRSRSLPFLALAAAAIALGCSDESSIGPKKVVSVRITPDTVRLVVGEVDTVRGFAIDEDGAFLANKRVDWTSSNPSVATVDADGTVTGISLGEADISATVGSVGATSKILVAPAPDIAISEDTVELAAIALSGTEPSSSVTITNGGGGLLTDLVLGTITYTGPATGWVSAQLDGSSAPATLSIAVTPGTLAVGEYFASIALLSDESTNSPVAVVVHMSLTADVPTTMALQAGDNQSVAAGTAVTTAPSVRITDQFGNPVSGTAVTFAVAGGGGSITGGAAVSNASGIAAVGSWTLGSAVGPNSLTATAAGLTGSPTTFHATGIAGTASQIAINGGNAQSAVAGQPVVTAPSVIVRDAFNNPVAAVAVTFTVASGGGQITGGAQTTNASGIATVGSWTLGTTAGANSLSVTSTGLTGSPLAITATGTPGPATAVAISAGNNQSAPAGTNVATAPSARVTDANGNGVPGVTVTFQVTGGGGSIAGATPATNASGFATITSWTLGSAVGTNTLSATAPGLTGSPLAFTANGVTGAASVMTVNAGDNQAASAGGQVTPPSVLVTDAFGNPVAGVSVTFAVTSGGGSITGGGQTTSAQGVATVGSWTLGVTAGVNTLSATSTGLTNSPITFTATGNPGNATNIALVQGSGQTGTVGSTLGTTLQVLVTDNLANPVQGVTVGWATGSGNLAPASSITNASGVATTTWTLGTSPGAVTASGSVGGLTGSPVVFSATANPGAPVNIVINAGNGQSATVNTAVATAPAVRISDQFNNPLSGVAVTFAVTAGGGSGTSLNAVTNASGIATVGSWTMGTVAGSNTMSATATGPGSTSFSATGTAGAATQIAISQGNGQSATVNTTVATQPRALVRDAFNNPVSNVSVTFAVTGGGGFVTGGSQLTNVSGLATLTGWTLGTTAGANSISATSGSLTGSPLAFTATGTPGAVTNFTQTGLASTLGTVNTAVSSPPAVIARDQFGNAVPSQVLTFTKSATNGAVNCGAGNVSPSCTITTNGSGVAATSAWVLGTVAGTNNNTLTVSRAGATSLVFTASASAGAASTVVVNTGNNQVARPNTFVGSTVSVLVRDAFLNAVPSQSVTFTRNAGGGLVACGGSETTACSVFTNASGVAQLSSWRLSNTSAVSSGAYPNSLTVTSSGTSGTSFNASAVWSFASDVMPIFNNNGGATCSQANCHNLTGPLLNGTASTTWNNIVNKPTSPSSCGQYIVSTNTGASFLYKKLIGTQGAGCGGNMPAVGSLLAGQANIIRDWINNGVPFN